eukprot:TRINITY_DN42929_c1_g1_i1.p1 TRINITY_DN42929_c1_g1~~TRINITY_DN42929_c1_g1_i1.p1  ORF type:complete len:112 (-),score=11.97 TRINITY_DN42929_c1_g1_i1:47-382(-)
MPPRDSRKEERTSKENFNLQRKILLISKGTFGNGRGILSLEESLVPRNYNFFFRARLATVFREESSPIFCNCVENHVWMRLISRKGDIPFPRTHGFHGSGHPPSDLAHDRF